MGVDNLSDLERVEAWRSGPLRVIDEFLETDLPAVVVSVVVSVNEATLRRLLAIVVDPALRDEPRGREALEAEFGELEW